MNKTSRLPLLLFGWMCLSACHATHQLRTRQLNEALKSPPTTAKTTATTAKKAPTTAKTTDTIAKKAPTTAKTTATIAKKAPTIAKKAPTIAKKAPTTKKEKKEKKCKKRPKTIKSQPTTSNNDGQRRHVLETSSTMVINHVRTAPTASPSSSSSLAPSMTTDNIDTSIDTSHHDALAKPALPTRDEPPVVTSTTTPATTNTAADSTTTTAGGVILESPFVGTVGDDESDTTVTNLVEDSVDKRVAADAVGGDTNDEDAALPYCPDDDDSGAQKSSSVPEVTTVQHLDRGKSSRSGRAAASMVVSAGSLAMIVAAAVGYRRYRDQQEQERSLEVGPCVAMIYG